MDLLSFWIGFAGGGGYCLAAAFEVDKKLMEKQEARLEACKDLVSKYGDHRRKCNWSDIPATSNCECGWNHVLWVNENDVLDKLIREKEGEHEL